MRDKSAPLDVRRSLDGFRIMRDDDEIGNERGDRAGGSVADERGIKPVAQPLATVVTLAPVASSVTAV
jgi:hypothetical protein